MYSFPNLEPFCNSRDRGSIPGSGRSSGEGIGYPTPVFLGFPCGSAGKESACNAGGLGLIPGLERSPGERKGYPLQYSCLENPPGQRSLAGYSPRGRKESDMTERLSIAHTLWETQQTQVWSLGHEDPLGVEMAVSSSILAWKIPWTEEPGRLQSVGSQRVGHSQATEHTGIITNTEMFNVYGRIA